MRRLRWRSPLALALALLAFVAVARLPSFVNELYDPDEATIAAQAIAMREGGTLYIDAKDRKPPIAPFAYEVSFTATDSTDLRPLHALVGLGLVAAAVVVALDARRRHGVAAGWWAGGLLVTAAIAFPPGTGQAANYAHFAIVPGAMAIVFARRGTRWSPPLAGLLLGLAVLSRQSWLVGLAPACLGAFVASRRGLANRLVSSASLVVAFVVSIASVGLFLPFSEFFRWTFTGNSGFLSASVDIGPTLGRIVATVAIFVIFHITLTYALGRLAIDHVRHWRSHLAEADLWLWMLTGLFAVTAGFRFFGHYWLQVIPPAVILAAPLLARLTGKRLRIAVAGVAVPTMLAMAFAWTPSTFRELPDPDPIASYVEANTAPGDYVWIWGSFPEVHWKANRPPGGAMVHSDFVTGLSGGRPAGPETVADSTPGALDEMLEALERQKPELVVDTSTAELRQYENYPLSDFPELFEFLTENYEQVAVVDDATIWRRNEE